ncbi:hypothetical protein [Streptomyces sp. NPDC058861]|uniref:hypothetical protein n=1 Tax=Streptomyces sp. NPDC058861 TaxID=3346653 RepID=UPI0036BC0F56
MDLVVLVGVEVFRPGVGVADRHVVRDAAPLVLVEVEVQAREVGRAPPAYGKQRGGQFEDAVVEGVPPDADDVARLRQPGGRHLEAAAGFSAAGSTAPPATRSPAHPARRGIEAAPMAAFLMRLDRRMDSLCRTMIRIHRRTDAS